MAFPYVDHTWAAGHLLSIARMNNLESQFQSVLDLLTTRGDISYRGAATWERLAKGNPGQFLEQGANDPFWADIDEATMEYFVPIFGGFDVDYRGANINGVGDDAWMALIVPQYFTALTSIEVIFQPNETGASMNFVITTY